MDQRLPIGLPSRFLLVIHGTTGTLLPSPHTQLLRSQSTLPRLRSRWTLVSFVLFTLLPVPDLFHPTPGYPGSSRQTHEPTEGPLGSSGPPKTSSSRTPVLPTDRTPRLSWSYPSTSLHRLCLPRRRFRSEADRVDTTEPVYWSKKARRQRS